MRSLRVKLNIGLGIILAGGFGASWILRSFALPYIAEQEMLTRLEHDADAIKNALGFDRSGQAQVDLRRQAPIYSQSHSGHYFVLQEDGNPAAITSPSLGPDTLNIPPLVEGLRRLEYAEGPMRQPLLLLTRRFSLGDHEFTLSVGEDLSAIRRDTRDVGYLFLLLNSLVIVLALLSQWFFVVRALRPYQLLRQELSLIAEGQDDFGEATGKYEALPLLDEIKRLMQLLNRRIQQSRTVIGNLAHALKTPLAILYRLADDPALHAQPELAREIKHHTSTIRKLMERELKRARLAGTANPGSRLNPRQELDTLIKVLRVIYAHKSLSFTIEAPDREIPYDRQDLLELLGNLTDNACKWARARVVMRIRHQDGLSIRIEDDGPGCTTEELGRLGERGLRLDETQAGHGLGLSIVRDVVEFYGGTLAYGRSIALGGFSVCVEIP